MTPGGDPRTLLADRRARLATLSEADRRLSALRGLAFVVGIGTALGVVVGPVWSAGWLIVPLVLFGVLVAIHAVVIRRRERAERAVAHYERTVARMDGRWEGLGPEGLAWRVAAHPYAAELDLFGRGSLFDLVGGTRTAPGEETLATWLLSPAPPDTVRARQEAVRELMPCIALREALATLDPDVGLPVDRERLTVWVGAAESFPRGSRAVAFGAAGAMATAILAALAGWLPGWVVLVTLGLEVAVAARLRSHVKRVARGVEVPLRALGRLSEVAGVLEREPLFQSPRLQTLRAALGTGSSGASAEARRLRRLVGLLDSRTNQLFAPFAALLLWTTQISAAIDAWRVRTGAAVPGWMEALGELDALIALAAYAAIHPEDSWPVFVEGPPKFEADGIAHPLLPADRAVRNDVRLGEVRLLVVSGSNMSGKSTLLRAVGVNLVLAQAGAPVRATRFLLTPCALGCAIQARDSLADGRSRFYSEIMRIRLVMDLAERGGDPPGAVVYLFDELLSGTNSHDRAVGAGAVLERLVGGRALGLVTTHDLALTAIADRLGPRAENVHFADEVRDGALAFDYRLRPGVVAHSNALALMRAVGLDV